MNSENYALIAEAIRYISANFKNQPLLEEVASHVGLSPFHFQRIFTEWAGISPKKFLQFLTIDELKRELQYTTNLIEAAELVGLSAQSRVYDLFVKIEAVTPQEFKTAGKNVEIKYGFHETPFGECFIAHTPKGICGLQFTDGKCEEVLKEFSENWSNALLKEDGISTKSIAQKLFYEPLQSHNFKLFLKGTPFQIKVWEALLKIPFGSVTSYSSIALAIGNNSAMRAVGSAVGANPVAFLIPCHRVIRTEGMIGNYHWGSERKSAMLGWEKSRLMG